MATNAAPSEPLGASGGRDVLLPPRLPGLLVVPSREGGTGGMPLVLRGVFVTGLQGLLLDGS